ncbi:MAG: hypothetical protein KGI10_03780 [Thaumarchaeota archaeon]|nr:hypothetical protein [Nitrososphaerota archaeon]
MEFRDFFKKSRREVNRENQSQGRQGEEQARREYEFSGHEVERTGKGHDLKVTKRDWLTGKKGKPKYVEVKTGNSKLSELQKKKKRQYGSRYIEKRYEPTPLGLIPKSNSMGHETKKKSSGYDSMFGLGGSSSSRKKTNSSGFDSMFGTGSSKKRRSSSSWGF